MIKRILPVLLIYLFGIDFNLVDSAGASQELVYLQILTTNGEFSPLELYPNDENFKDFWPDGFGDLTKLGKIQHYELGKQLRDRYKNFITSSPTEVDAFSPSEDRSTHSLLCFMASFYAPTEEWEFMPGFHWQPIPVSYLDNNDIFFKYPENCAAQIREKQKLYKTSPGKEYILRNKLLYSYWTNHSGAHIENWNDVAKLYDILDKEKKYGYKVPSWAVKYWDEMKNIADAAYGLNYQSLKSLQLKIGPLLSLMTLRMQAKIYEEDPIKVSVYMTHDRNLAAFLSAIKHFNGLRPPPCATVAIEMFRNISDSQHSVRMTFYNSTTPELGNGNPLLLKLGDCSEYCPLEKFVAHFINITSACADYDTTCEGIIENHTDEFLESSRNYDPPEFSYKDILMVL